MKIDIRLRDKDVRKFEKLAVKYGKKNIDTHISRALNKALTKTKSATSDPKGMSQQIRLTLNVKAKDLRKWLKKTKVNKTNMSGKVSLLGTGRMNLAKFGAKQTRRGVSYRIEKSGKRRLMPHAFGPAPKFISKLGGQVYVREHGAKRLPIRKAWGVSVLGFVKKNRMKKGFIKTANKRVRMELKERLRMLKATGWGSKN